MISGDIVYVLAVPVVLGWSVVAYRRAHGWLTWGLGVLAIVHLSAVVNLTLFPLPVQAEVIAEGREFHDARNNFVPLASLLSALATGSNPSVISQSIGNLLMLAPLGFYGPRLWPRIRSWQAAVLVGFLTSLGIELTQLGISSYLGYTYKIADVDDLILNTAGVALGYAVFLRLPGNHS
jgi:glycopeptide antibiotics resistance protein